jgi:hypothetical protein
MAVTLVEGTLTHNQILALSTTPISLVAAQGAGKLIVPVYMALHYKFLSGAYSPAEPIALYWATSLEAMVGLTATQMGASSDQFVLTNTYANAPAAAQQNTALNLWNPSGTNMGSGGGTVLYSVLYEVSTQ